MERNPEWQISAGRWFEILFENDIFRIFVLWGEKNENSIFDRRNDGRWQNDSKSATEKELANSVFS